MTDRRINISDFYIDVMRDMLSMSLREEREIGAPLCKVDDQIIIDLSNLSIGNEFNVNIPDRCSRGEYVGSIHTHIGSSDFSVKDIVSAIRRGSDVECLCYATEEEAGCKCIRIEKPRNYNELQTKARIFHDALIELDDAYRKLVDIGREFEEEYYQVFSRLAEILRRTEEAIADKAIERGVIRGRRENGIVEVSDESIVLRVEFE